MINKEKITVEMSPRNLEDFIWMSYRYCIGRKTIAAAAHACTIAELIFKNPNSLSEDRKEFMAQDIRQCILDTLKWNKRLRFENNYHWYNTNWDFYTLLLEGMSECPYPNEAVFVIDFENRKLTWERREYQNRIDKPDDMYNDLIGWVKLANALDKTCHKDIVVNVNGKEYIERCFPYVARTQNEYKQVWASLEQDAGAKIDQQGFIIPELIVGIKDIK